MPERTDGTAADAEPRDSHATQSERAVEPRDTDAEPRETMEFDVVIVGAGPAGLAAACRLGQLNAETEADVSICVVEKAAEVGGHIVSGALFETRALTELFPDWAERGAPVDVEVTAERVTWLSSARRSVDVPGFLVPAPMRNHGNYVVSLGALCRWLGERAEALGCNVLPGFAAADVLHAEDGRVVGVATGDMGRARDGSKKPTFQPGYALTSKYVIFAEGCRGHLGRRLEARFDLRRGRDPQHYGLGLKEVWEVDPAQHRRGEVMHTLGWPLDGGTDGGGFLYHTADNRVSLGFIVALDYRNPYLSPFEEFQRWKRHPRVERVLRGGRRIGFAARAVNKGGLSSLPKLAFPGGLLAGCEAGFLNGAKIKGTHTAIKTGMLAAESVFAALADGDAGGRELDDYERSVRESWVGDELRRARNFSAGFKRFGRLGGSSLAFVEHNLLRGRFPLTLRDDMPDHARLEPAGRSSRIEYPPPDGIISFDRLSSVYLANTEHDEDQPVHLRLRDESLPITHNLPVFDEPAQRYCPAAVYEIVADAGAPRFQINAANCVHCKACDIKDPSQNIEWVPPQGGSGPNYSGM